MLPPDAFLRNAPRIVDLENRLIWEVVVNASDAVGHSHQRLLNALAKIVDSQAEGVVVEELKPEICVYCWSIIDHAHAFMQVVKGLPRKPAGLLDSFLNKFQESIYDMRNSIKHIKQNIRNISKKKSASPIYGSLAFMTPLREDLTAEVISFSLGGFQFNEEVGCAIDTTLLPNQNSVSNILFSSFKSSLNISDLCVSMSAVVNSMSETAMSEVLPKIKSITREDKAQFDKVLSENVRGGVIVRLRIDYRANYIPFLSN